MSKLSKLSAKVAKDKKDLDALSMNLKTNLRRVQQSKYTRLEKESGVIIKSTSFYFQQSFSTLEKFLVGTKLADSVDTGVTAVMVAKEGDLLSYPDVVSDGNGEFTASSFNKSPIDPALLYPPESSRTTPDRTEEKRCAVESCVRLVPPPRKVCSNTGYAEQHTLL